jgi:hypothetical protein
MIGIFPPGSAGRLTGFKNIFTTEGTERTEEYKYTSPFTIHSPLLAVPLGYWIFRVGYWIFRVGYWILSLVAAIQDEKGFLCVFVSLWLRTVQDVQNA